MKLNTVHARLNPEDCRIYKVTQILPAYTKQLFQIHLHIFLHLNSNTDWNKLTEHAPKHTFNKHLDITLGKKKGVNEKEYCNYVQKKKKNCNGKDQFFMKVFAGYASVFFFRTLYGLKVCYFCGASSKKQNLQKYLLFPETQIKTQCWCVWLVQTFSL